MTGSWRTTLKRVFTLGIWRRELALQDADAELESVLAERVALFTARGMSPDEARAEAIRRLGEPLEDARSHLRRSAERRDDSLRHGEVLDGIRDDVRLALRGLRREPVFSLFVILTLALAIGANAGMFGIVDKLLFRGPAHVGHPQSLYRLYWTIRGAAGDERTAAAFDQRVYANLQAESRSFSGLAMYTRSAKGVRIGDGRDARPVSSAQVTSNFLGVLESRPLLGRFFTFEEQTNPSAPPVVVLGYGLWTREFGGDSAVVGRQISVSGRKVAVVGVMPEGFTGVELERVDLWRVLPTKVGPAARHWGNGSSMGPAIVGRLRDGLTLEEASAEVTGVQRRTYDGPDKSIRDSRIFAAPLSFGIDGTESTQSRIASWLIVLSIVVLLVACANIVNLQLARGIRQRREMAVRVTLGAGRARLARLLIINSLTLSVIGGTIGLVVAYTAGSLVRRVLLPEVDWTTSPIDSRVMLYTIVAAALTGLLTGVLPALAASRVELSGALKTGTREGGGTRSRVRDGLIVAQAALGMVLLVGAGLFVKSLERVMAADLGLDVNRVVLVRPRWSSVPADKAEAEAARRAAVMQAAAGQFRRLPSVTGVAAASAMPFNGSMAYTLTLPGRTSLPVLEGGFSDPDVSVVSPEYFAAVGTRIVRGRSFTDADRGSHVAVVSQTMAKVLWPGTDAIGQCMQLGKGSDLPCIRIVGIAQDARRSRIKESPIMRYYVPVGQEATFSDQPDLVVRARESVDATAAAVRDAMYHIDPSIRYVDVAPLRDQIEPQTRSWRIGALVFSMFAALVLVVAAVGTFGIVAYVIEQRRHEIGIRVALGARASQIVALMLRGSVVFTAAGVALGAIAVALLAGRATPLLFETSPRDPAVIALVGGLLLAVSVAASLIPAWRAPRVDPMEALRGD